MGRSALVPRCLFGGLGFVIVLGLWGPRGVALSPPGIIIALLLGSGVAVAQGVAVRNTLEPWTANRVPFWPCLAGALVLDALLIGAGAAVSSARNLALFLPALAAAFFVTWMTLRLWCRLGNLAAALSAVPLMAGALNALMTAGIVFGALVMT